MKITVTFHFEKETLKNIPRKLFRLLRRFWEMGRVENFPHIQHLKLLGIFFIHFNCIKLINTFIKYFSVNEQIISLYLHKLHIHSYAAAPSFRSVMSFVLLYK